MRLAVCCALSAVGLLACTASSDVMFGEMQNTSINAGNEGDPCAPGNQVDAAKHPDAVCGIRTTFHAPDLLRGQKRGGAAQPQTSGNVGLLDAPGAEAQYPSCARNAGPGFDTCGPNGNDSCCRAPEVPAGVADAILEIKQPYRLGAYEVTAARMHAFVDAVDGNLRQAALDGRLPGFDVAHADQLPASRAEVDLKFGRACKARSDRKNGALTWWSQDVQDAVAEYVFDDNARAADIRADATKPRLDAKPANCMTYYEAAAFCAWDGGRLPSYGEWDYAALGGAELRTYPWGDGRTRERLVTDMNRMGGLGAHGMPDLTFPEDFPWFGDGHNAYHIAPPGRKPAGIAKWGHYDMSGNVFEWTAETSMADLDGVVTAVGTVRGGSWEGHEGDENVRATGKYPLLRSYGSVGLRCAYGAAQPQEPNQPVEEPNEPNEPNEPVVAKHPVYLASAMRGQAEYWLLSPNQGTGADVGYVTHGVQFQLLDAAAGDSTVELRLCSRPATGILFVSSEANCEGGEALFSLGHAQRDQVAGAAPIYRCYDPRTAAHISTLDPQRDCVDRAMDIEGTQGFAFPAN